MRESIDHFERRPNGMETQSTKGKVKNEPASDGNFLCHGGESGLRSDCYSYQLRISDSDIIR